MANKKKNRERKQISAVVPVALHLRLKHAAIRQGITASEAMTRAITEYLNKRPSAA